MIDLYQPSSYLKKLVVKKSDEIFVPSDPPSIPLHPVPCSWRLSCLDCIKSPLSSSLQLCMKNRERQHVRGWEEQEVGILIPSVLSPRDLQTDHIPLLKATATLWQPTPHSWVPVAAHSPLLLQAQRWQQLLSITTSGVTHSPFLIPLTPAGAFVSRPSIKPSSGTQFECALRFQKRPYLIFRQDVKYFG